MFYSFQEPVAVGSCPSREHFASYCHQKMYRISNANWDAFEVDIWRVFHKHMSSWKDTGSGDPAPEVARPVPATWLDGQVGFTVRSSSPVQMVRAIV